MPFRSIGRPFTARLAGLAVALAALFAGCGDEDAQLQALVRDPAPDVSGVSLPDAASDGTDFPLRADAGGLLLVYFGYTSCPDVCPTTLADVRQALDAIDADEADRVDLAMVTIDPERDTDEVLTGYVRSFVPDAHALVATSEADLRAAADAFGATYLLESNPEGGIDVSHTSSIFVVDEEARITAIWPFGVSDADIASDLGILLARSA